MKLIKPLRLNSGDTIGIITPTWSFDAANFKKGVTKLKKMGYRVKYDYSILSRFWTMAGFDKERADQINQMFAAREVKAIFCAKGGYGSIRILAYLDPKIISQNPKIFLGYSDITLLLLYLQTVANMVVFHGPVIAGEICSGMNYLTEDYLKNSISQNKPLGRLSFPRMRAFKKGKANGRLTGGNLSMIMALMGTPYELNTDGSILFLEDTNEDIDVIDRYLMQLKLAGKFANVKGIIFGRMVDCFDYSRKRYKIRDVLKNVFVEYDFPIIFGFPGGHLQKRENPHITLPFGVSATINSEPASVTFNEAGVR